MPASKKADETYAVARFTLTDTSDPSLTQQFAQLEGRVAGFMTAKDLGGYSAKMQEGILTIYASDPGRASNMKTHDAIDSLARRWEAIQRVRHNTIEVQYLEVQVPTHGTPPYAAHSRPAAPRPQPSTPPVPRPAVPPASPTPRAKPKPAAPKVAPPKPVAAQQTQTQPYDPYARAKEFSAYITPYAADLIALGREKSNPATTYQRIDKLGLTDIVDADPAHVEKRLRDDYTTAHPAQAKRLTELEKSLALHREYLDEIRKRNDAALIDTITEGTKRIESEYETADSKRREDLQTKSELIQAYQQHPQTQLRKKLDKPETHILPLTILVDERADTYHARLVLPFGIKDAALAAHILTPKQYGETLGASKSRANEDPEIQLMVYTADVPKTKQVDIFKAHATLQRALTTQLAASPFGRVGIPYEITSTFRQVSYEPEHTHALTRTKTPKPQPHEHLNLAIINAMQTIAQGNGTQISYKAIKDQLEAAGISSGRETIQDHLRAMHAAGKTSIGNQSVTIDRSGGKRGRGVRWSITVH